MSSFFDLLDKHEGGGRYDTLFGHSQREGGRFAGVDPTQMTLGEMRAFTDPSGEYGQWVKQQLANSGQKARVATPAGRYQIVGTTMRNTQDALGLSDDTLFDQRTQDMMGEHLAKQRIASAKSPAARRAAMRAEWEGFKHVSDEDLDQAITGLISGKGMPQQQQAGLGPTRARAEAGLPLNTRSLPEEPEYMDNGIGRLQQKRDEMRAGLGEKLGVNDETMKGAGRGLMELSRIIQSGGFG